MNARSDPTEEERKGGSGKIGKMIFSMTADTLAVVAYVPLNNSEKCNAKEWLTHVVEMVTDKKLGSVTFAPAGEVDTANYFTCVIKRDADANIFPMKLRDPAISSAYAYLKARDLFPDDDDEDD